ncbi:hypothetical protein SAMN04489740_3302 [Arthrobacter alpinus]|uniref:WXG100 family type VII secretion target n=1 Tax=Arthrobacter alpinus TaxID=656366 RepID=A0A1H5N1B9_9MICC|nr:hypothetical protein [Arthrobacter alpinus]ALV46720.1 hypothetical protein MB46_15680 [Arthrobacter alpinus]SEE61400.1 hypothetical protein SAMN04489740_1922 [Arthrobacter alpinus]SEE95364.1 hypothetical protein SAMN04489740_3302 [Arthrobacter alpinus]
MAGGMIGNDPADMADLVSKLGQAIDQITQVMSTLDSKAQSVRWEGPDANNFKGSQWPTSKKQLANVVSDLGQVKTLVNKQKQQQIDTSAH